jgi:prepilin-type N-terminal cleavage/methylation domain-containing protein
MRTFRSARGMTLIETMATMVVLSFGLLGVTFVVLQGSRTSRRSYTQQQAYSIAEMELERLIRLGCTRDGFLCSNLVGFDGNTSTVYWGAEGAYSTSPDGGAGTTSREFQVAIDIDPPFEGAETGSPPTARIGVVNLIQTTIVNIRVSVSWREDTQADTAPMRVVSVQTRVSP